jgi:XisI protein
MDILDQYRSTLYTILSEYVPLLSKSDRTTSNLIVSEDHNHFMLLNEGWEGKRRIHSLIFMALTTASPMNWSKQVFPKTI